MSYTQIKIKKEYRDKLAKLAASHNRSMANMVEVLIDGAVLGTDSHPSTAARKTQAEVDRGYYDAIQYGKRRVEK